MASVHQGVLAGRRILVPPARSEGNPLRGFLERRGATTVEFPALQVVPPEDGGPLDRALGRLGDFDWIICAGRPCAAELLARLAPRGPEAVWAEPARLAAIGYGAAAALAQAGLTVDYVPARHTAEEVAAGLGEVRGRRVLLVRVAEAGRDLPARLAEAGALVTEADGYRMAIAASVEGAREALGPALDAVAFASPTAVRYLARAAAQVGIDLPGSLGGVLVAAAGPATEAAASRAGLPPAVVAGGSVADLAAALVRRLGRASG